MQDDFLLEIGTEEIPAKLLLPIAEAINNNLISQLKKAELTFTKTEFFATPRRLAVIVYDLTAQQPDRFIERKGPAVIAAFDKEGKPTPACSGFARSCQIEVEQLQRKMFDKGEFLFYNFKQAGQETQALLPELIKNTLAHLPIPRPMRWGIGETEFIRPVQWALALYGKNVIKTEVLGLITSNKTQGHRFLHPEIITLNHPRDYEEKLFQANVIANFDKRKASIRQQLETIAAPHGQVHIDEELLHEVTGLVEWPVALLASFEEKYLNVPKEVLITGMKVHQKSFPLLDKQNNLLPYFITITNLISKEPVRVIAGNERVMRARLSDAAFFYDSDVQHALSSRLEKLKNVVFQTKLGSVYDKSMRVTQLAKSIANTLHINPVETERAALLAKTDLLSDMVGEFPELQGIMGYYYALQDKEPEVVAIAIKEHYQPRFAGDHLPTSSEGCAVALADRIDTLVGIFSIGQAPTGEKDPFGLRRAALGICRILIEKKLPLDLEKLLRHACQLYSLNNNETIITETFNFIMERLRAYYAEQSISADVFAAVQARNPTQPLDFHHRLLAVQHFSKLSEAIALVAANKRVSNILKKEALISPHSKINPSLLMQQEETNLNEALMHQAKTVESLCQAGDYKAALISLAELRQPIDNFFDKVMVMVEDEKIRTNRLVLLMNLQHLFLQIADISLLQIE